MLVRTLIGATLAAVAMGAVAESRTAQLTAGDPVAAVRLLACDREGHDAAFQGRMRRLPGTRRMAMRFTLLERMPAGRFEPVDAEGLGRWRKSRPRTGVFAYRQGVRGLVDGAAYRTVVQFRWYDRAGEVLRRERRRSRICDQSGPLPNLRARVIGAEPTNVPGVVRYAVRVVNRGHAAASDVGVRLSVDGGEVNRRNVSSLPPGEPQVLVFSGPRCERVVQTMADPAAVIDEEDERDNGHAVSCSQLLP